MIRNNFDYTAPSALHDVMEAMNSGAVVMSGDQSLVGQLKRGDINPRVVVSLKNIPSVQTILPENENLLIGGMVTYKTLLSDPNCQPYSALLGAVRATYDPHLLHYSTIGGAFANNYGTGSAVVAALAVMEAKLSLMGPGGKRTETVSQYLKERSVSFPDEFIHHVSVANAFAGNSTFEYIDYLKTGRIACGAAVYLHQENGRVISLRIALSGGRNGAVRLEGFENQLVGKVVTGDLLKMLTDKMEDEPLPLENEIISSRSYLTHLYKVLVTRGIKKLLTV
jgi:aerobic carbon-monoxide dehydrogenase medium subunit